jgi:serine-type D-Ala-D-Ala carboxypeptidase/endopeptidase (penicillin-binding protein 4)
MRAAALFLLLSAHATSQSLPEVLNEWKKDPALRNASFSYCVMDVRSGSVVAEYNSAASLAPASTLKIITTGAALGLLGPKYRYRTEICYTGKLDSTSGVLHGDIVVMGCGDPTLGSEHFGSENPAVPAKWASMIKAAGIKNVLGKVVGNASAFERKIPDHWIWSDISNYFGAVPCGLSFGDNKFTLTYRTAAAGSAATLVSVSKANALPPMAISSSVVAGGTSDAAYIYGDPFGYNRQVTGSLPPQRDTFNIEGAHPDPALELATAMTKGLQAAGIKSSEPPVSFYDRKKNSYTLLFEHASPALAEIVRVTNLRSNNHYCESLIQTLGGGSHAAGLQAVKKYWSEKGLDTTELFMADGSGLSRASALTSRFQAAALAKIFHEKEAYDAINASLAVAGESGALATLGKGKPIEGKLRAKTGYIMRARSYCGYYTTTDGRELSFSVILNNYHCPPKDARMKLERFLLAMGTI